MNYNPYNLVLNRDIIRFITCLGWNKSFEVKEFIKHCKDCRLSNKIPRIDDSRQAYRPSSSDYRTSSEDLSEGKRSTENEDILFTYSNVK